MDCSAQGCAVGQGCARDRVVLGTGLCCGQGCAVGQGCAGDRIVLGTVLCWGQGCAADRVVLWDRVVPLEILSLLWNILTNNLGEKERRKRKKRR